MKKSTLILVTTLGFVAMQVPVVQAADAKKGPPKFNAIDIDKDKFLTEEEFSKATEAGVKFKFKKLDKNKDGKLSKKEYAIVMGDEECE